MSDSNKATIRRVFDEVINAGKMDVIDEIYDVDIVDHDPLPGAPPGIEGVHYSIGGLRDAFPDLQVSVEDMAAHGDLVTVHNVWTGTQRGKLVGLPATGRTVIFSGVVIWRVIDGKITERWALTDLVQKVGVAGRRKRRRNRAAEQSLHSEGAVTPYTSLQPIPPDRYDEWLEFQEQLKGERHEEFVASRKRLGVKREVQWLSVWPRVGDLRFEIGYYEVEDLIKFGTGLATSEDPFDVWFRERVAHLHGFDWGAVAELGPSTELMFEYVAE
jgi:steroid delta-isomerase-like uncharacterized protein